MRPARLSLASTCAHNTGMKQSIESHQTLTANPHGRDFILADLHGHRARLDAALAEREFDPKRDRLFSVGDLIDRGPDSPACLELLDEPWFFAVRGNHEQMLIDALRSQQSMSWSRWLMNGGNWALHQPEQQLEVWAEQLDQLPHTLTIEFDQARIGLCHAQYRLPHWDDRLDASDYDKSDWVWGRSRLAGRDDRSVAGVDWLFHGHTIVERVERLGNSVFIDRGAYNDGPLVLINVADWLTGTDSYSLS
ncbi:metallophosphoesterase [Saccharospirillum mangrovi]|uniref:metallophosphoesterase n=1 Tax=Saccharospirillum mangrovi TaxID=2161747 RepID=UPI000D380E84|nr:metallophosphoesterase [Saccharospirillum mangrovi]